MMGRLNHDQRQLFYSFSLEEAVPDDRLVRKIAAVIDLSWVHAELAACADATLLENALHGEIRGAWMRTRSARRVR